MGSWAAVLAGAALCGLALGDVFMTVLYARSDLQLLSGVLHRRMWEAFRLTSRRLPRGQRWLTFAGPSMLVALIAMWVLLWIVGFALVCWPALGDGIQKTSGPTPEGFVTALYYSGYTFATLGYGDLIPQTGGHRLLAVVGAIAGFSVLTLSLSYVVSVYSALVRRNAFAQLLHHRTDDTDEPTRLLVLATRSGPTGFAAATLAELAPQLTQLYESHHSYPILHFFYFRPPHYAMHHVAALIAEASVLAETVLDERRHPELARSMELRSAERAAVGLLRRLSELFLPSRYQPTHRVPDAEGAAWRAEFDARCQSLAAEGLSVREDRDAAFAEYVRRRRQWQPYADAFARYMAPPSASRD